MPGLSSIAGVLGWPVGVEPTRRRFTAGSRCRFGFGHSASTRSRTRNAGSARPRDVRFTTEARSSSTPARSRTWTCSFGRSRGGSVSPPRYSVPGAGVEPTPTGSEPAVLPLDDPGIGQQPVGVSIPSGRREKPATSPEVERAVWRVAQVGVEPTASLVLSEGGLPVAYRATFRRTPRCQRPGHVARQRKRRESNPQGSSLSRLATGFRHQSICPSVSSPSTSRLSRPTSSGRRGSRTLKACARPGSNGVPSPVGLPFRFPRVTTARLPTEAARCRVTPGRGGVRSWSRCQVRSAGTGRDEIRRAERAVPFVRSRLLSV